MAEFNLGDFAVHETQGFGQFVSTTVHEGMLCLVWQGEKSRLIAGQAALSPPVFRKPMTKHDAEQLLLDVTELPEPLTGNWDDRFKARMTAVKANDPARWCRLLQSVFIEVEYDKRSATQEGLGAFRMRQVTVLNCAAELAHVTGQPAGALEKQLMTALETAVTQMETLVKES